MLVLLTIVAVGLLSLSAITLRSTRETSAQAEARANARLALMIAIGELQMQMGPDQRISANAAIINAGSTVAHPHWTGVWDSWVAGDLAQAPVGDSYPSAASHHQTLGSQPERSMRPDYAEKNGHFRRWLVSLDSAKASEISAAKNPFNGAEVPTASDDAIQLVGKGSLGKDANPADFVTASLLAVDPTAGAKGSGRYGWWVGDESQKALITNDPYHGESLTSADKIFRAQSPGSTGTTTIAGLADMTPEQQRRLQALPTRKSLDLVPGVTQVDEGGTFRASERNFHHATHSSYQVLADVREGGLKRDLSTLLERPINRNERSNEFMLYKFDIKDAWANRPGLPDTPQEAVPIQDLAAFYQLYDQSRMGGVEYNSAQLGITSPNYGNKTSPWRVTENFTGMYRQPVPVKVQFILSLHTEGITPEDRARTHVSGGQTYLSNASIPATDTHKLRIAVLPIVTLWNPYNIPLTMQSGEVCQSFRLRSPSFLIGCEKRRATSETYRARDLNMTFAAVGSSVTDGRAEGRADLMRLNFGYSGPPVSFEPGEVRVFSMPFTTINDTYVSGGNDYNRASNPVNHIEATSGWNSTGFYTFKNSTPNSGNRNTTTISTDLSRGECNVVWEGDGSTRFSLSLAAGDEFDFTIQAEQATTNSFQARNVAASVAPIGSAMTYYMVQRNLGIAGYNHINLFNNSFITRMGRRPGGPYPAPFINQLMRQGIPNGEESYTIEPISGSQIINATGGANMPLMQFALMAGTEVNESIGDFAGRKFPMRPFIHSSPLGPTLIDKNDPTAPYMHGWSWWMEDISSILSALVQNTQSGRGFYGGGYTPEAGVTHVIQQEIPVTPPISIAALSHARLGGFTLANEAPVGEGFTGAVSMEGYGGGWSETSNHLVNPSMTLGFQRVTASGQGGLYPHTLQAIGNSYAHPMLAADRAFNDQYTRHYDQADGPRQIVFADHSYLANKALWDQFFFSSITPQPASIEIFGGAGRNAQQVASDFFIDSKPLPNRRMVPYLSNLKPADLNALFAEKDEFTNGLADKIAAKLLVEGAFNVNSTSVSAWKTFLSSLKGKPIAYLNGGKTPQEASITGVPVGGFTLPTSPAISTINDSKSPAEQWLGLREISDEEIDQLAEAIVNQIKLRGPFLSLSEFVNRRLDADNIEFSVKGALQAALDSPNVDINRSFLEDDDRRLDDEVAGLGFAFQRAAEGPTAYGSSAYVDQADILRHLGSQLTVRGDTFIIRAYGDSMNASGNVMARAWCEAVVQRVPDYVDSMDSNHLKQNALSSASNKKFGRKFIITGFRWLNKDEV